MDADKLSAPAADGQGGSPPADGTRSVPDTSADGTRRVPDTGAAGPARRQSRMAPLALLAVGISAAVYGASFHRIHMVEPRQEEFSVAVPIAGAPWQGAPGSWRNAPQPPASGPPVKFVKRRRTVDVLVSALEPAVNRAVTVERITRDTRGKLVQAPASVGGPAFCPT